MPSPDALLQRVYEEVDFEISSTGVAKVKVDFEILGLKF